MGQPLQVGDQTMAKNFAAFPTGNRFSDFSGSSLLPLAEVEICVLLQIRFTCCGRHIPAIDTIAASLFQLSGDWLSVISSLH